MPLREGPDPSEALPAGEEGGAGSAEAKGLQAPRRKIDREVGVVELFRPRFRLVDDRIREGCRVGHRESRKSPESLKSLDQDQRVLGFEFAEFCAMHLRESRYH